MTQQNHNFPLQPYLVESNDTLRLRDEPLQVAERGQLIAAVKSLGKTKKPTLADRFNLVFYEAMLNKDEHSNGSVGFKRMAALAIAHAARLEQSSPEHLLGIEALSERLAAVTQERDNLKTVAADAPRIAEENQQFATRQAELAEEVERLTSERDEALECANSNAQLVAQRDATIDSLNAQLLAYDNSSKEQQAWAENILKQMADKDAEISLLTEQNTLLKSSAGVGDTSALQSRITQFEVAQGNLEEKLRLTEASNQRLAADNACLQKQLKELPGAAYNATVVADLQSAIDGLKAEKERMLAQLSDFKDQRADLVKKNEALERKLGSTFSAGSTKVPEGMVSVSEIKSRTVMVPALLEIVSKMLPDVNPKLPDTVVAELALDRLRNDFNAILDL